MPIPAIIQALNLFKNSAIVPIFYIKVGAKFILAQYIMFEYFWTGEEFPIGTNKVHQRDQLDRHEFLAANQTNPDASFIIPLAMSTNLSQRMSVFNRSVQSEDIVVSVALPTAFLMPAVNIFNGKVFTIRSICTMNNDFINFSQSHDDLP